MKIYRIAFDQSNSFEQEWIGKPEIKDQADLFGKEELGDIYNLEYEDVGVVYRGVSKEDFARIQEQGFIDTDLRGGISKEEGINLTTDPQTATEYLPKEGGVVLAIKTDQLNLYLLKSDGYIRSFTPIPVENIIGHQKIDAS